MSEDRNKKLKRIIATFVVSMVGCAALGLIIELVMTQMYGKYAFTKGPSRPIFAMVWIGVAFWGAFSLIYLCTLPSRLRQQRAYEQMLLQQEQFFEQMRSLAGDGVPAKEFLAVYDALRQSDFAAAREAPSSTPPATPRICPRPCGRLRGNTPTVTS